MFVTVWRRCTFDASHQLPDHPGVCKRLHGHTYTVELGVDCPVNPNTGMGIDMIEIKEFLRMNVEGKYDHQHLNEKLEHTTAEFIAAAILDDAKREWEKYQVTVRVFESPNSWVEASR